MTKKDIEIETEKCAFLCLIEEGFSIKQILRKDFLEIMVHALDTFN